MQLLSRALSHIQKVFDWVAAGALIAIMCVVFCDVILRYLLNSPLSWAYDLIGIYLVASVFYFSLSGAYSAGAHVNVDILQQKLPWAAIQVTEVVSCAVGIVVFALIAYVGALRAVEAFQLGDVLSGAIAWPTWPALAIVPLGCALLTLRLTLRLAAHLINLAAGREVHPVGVANGHGMGFE